MTYLPRLPYLQLLRHLPGRRSHALFEHDTPLHECRGFAKHFGAGHGRDEDLWLSAFEIHDRPYLGESQDGRGVGGIDGEGLRLVEDDHFWCGRLRGWTRKRMMSWRRWLWVLFVSWRNRGRSLYCSWGPLYCRFLISTRSLCYQSSNDVLSFQPKLEIIDAIVFGSTVGFQRTPK